MNVRVPQKLLTQKRPNGRKFEATRVMTSTYCRCKDRVRSQYDEQPKRLLQNMRADRSYRRSAIYQLVCTNSMLACCYLTSFPSSHFSIPPSVTMSFSALASFVLFSASVLAQQYAGDYIPGSLPQRSGSEIAYFKIRDPSNVNDHLTLINYYSLGSDGNRIKPSNVQRAVIMMSGQRRDANQYIGYVS
jgi:hypothetical protein